HFFFAAAAILARVLPLPLPENLAGGLIERDDELHVDAVALHDQQVIPYHRRAARPVLMVVLEFLSLPDNLPVGRQTGSSMPAEVNVNAVILNHGCRRGVAVVG